MGILDRIRGIRPSAPADAAPRERQEPTIASAPRAKTWLSGTAGGGFLGLGVLPGSTGIAVTPYTALQAATVYKCCDRLSKDIGKLPLRVHRRLRRGGTKVDYDHPLNALLRRPNRWHTSSQMWRFYVWNLALRGNGYAPIIRGPSGQPVEIVPMSSDFVGVMKTADGGLVYQVNHPAFRAGTTLTGDDMLHAWTQSFDGMVGISPISLAQDAIGLALATQQHGATLFRQGAQLNGFIKHPGSLSPEAKNYLAQEFAAKNAGVQNAHRTPVLDENMSFEKASMTNEDAQFLATRNTQVTEICRYFDVPPHKVFDMSNAHYANLEMSEQQYVNDTLLPLGGSIEQTCERNLLFEHEQGDVILRFEFDALLRADRKTRYDTYTSGINGGFLSRNEARIDDNREPNVPRGDEFLQPLNMATSDAAAVVPAAPAAPESEQEMQ